MQRVLDYVRESRAELKRVTWPAKEQMIRATWIVIVLTSLMACYMWVVDLGLTALFNWAF